MMYVGNYNVDYLGKNEGYEEVVIDRFSGDTRTRHIRLYFLVDDSISLFDLLRKEKMLDRLIKCKPNAKISLDVNIQQI